MKREPLPRNQQERITIRLTPEFKALLDAVRARRKVFALQDAGQQALEAWVRDGDGHAVQAGAKDIPAKAVTPAGTEREPVKQLLELLRTSDIESADAARNFIWLLWSRWQAMKTVRERDGQLPPRDPTPQPTDIQ